MTSQSPEPPDRIPLSRIYLLALIELAVLGPIVTALFVSLSVKVLQIAPHTKESSLALVTAVGAMVALVSNPIWGHISDRTRSRFGRRRPWLITGVLLGVVSAVMMLLAPNVGWLTAGWGLGQLGYNAATAALHAMFADQVPEAQRSKASGIFGAFGFLGVVPAMLIAALFADNLAMLMLGMPALSVVIVVAVCAIVPDPPAAARPGAHPASGRRLTGAFRSFVFNPLRVPMFSLVWLQRCVMQFGYTIVGTFGLYYLLERLGMDKANAVSLVSVSAIVGAALNTLAAFGCGFLAARRGNYGPFVIASVVAMALSLALKAFTGDLAIFWAATVIAGFALGTYYAIDMALVLRTLPAGEQGKYLGIFNTAKTLPQSLAPAVAPFMLELGGPDPVSGHAQNYASLYLIGALTVGLSLVVLPGIRPALRRQPSNATPRNAEEVVV
ncbi:MFS transporter [Saccharopolyspora sp. NPDC003752]